MASQSITTNIAFDSPEFLENPYPPLAALRAEPGPVWHPGIQLWLAARHADVNFVMRNKAFGRVYMPREPQADWETFNWLHADSILDCEPPKHTRLRALVGKAFHRGRLEGLRGVIEQQAERLLVAAQVKLPAQGFFDLIADYAEPLPVMIIAAMLGVPECDEVRLRRWSQAIVKAYEIAPTPQDEAEAQHAARDFAEYIEQLAQERRKSRGEDLISDLTAVEEAGEKLSLHELIATCVLLLNAGHEASVNGLGNGLVALFGLPEQLHLMQTDPGALAPNAIEEFLRYDPPLQFFERTATQDVELNGATITAGQKVALLLGAANRDAAVFDSPDAMDIARDPNPHLAFGAGIHFCLGAPLARLELSVALEALFRKFPKLILAGTPTRRPTFVLRGYESIPVSTS